MVPAFRLPRQTIDFNRLAAHQLRPMDAVYGTSVSVGGDERLAARTLRLRPWSDPGGTRLIRRCGALLVAGGQTLLRRNGDYIEMSAPAELAGLLEVRGLGIVRVPKVATAPLRLVFDLMPPDQIEAAARAAPRHAAGRRGSAAGAGAQAASAAARVRLALKSPGAPLVAGALAPS